MNVIMRRRVNTGSGKKRGAVPLTIRLPKDVIEKIDHDPEQWNAPLSRNNWLLEAAIEKLRKSSSGDSHGPQ